jgi:hypothetical protein
MINKINKERRRSMNATPTQQQEASGKKTEAMYFCEISFRETNFHCLGN